MLIRKLPAILFLIFMMTLSSNALADLVPEPSMDACFDVAEGERCSFVRNENEGVRGTCQNGICVEDQLGREPNMGGMTPTSTETESPNTEQGDSIAGSTASESTDQSDETGCDQSAQSHTLPSILAFGLLGLAFRRRFEQSEV